jgi:endonuclease/exonuclease/phosphatase family metal-dependent hydrolase
LRKSVELGIVTFNIQDLYLASQYRRPRVAAIAEILCELKPDIVGLQEAFISADRDLLLRGVAGCGLTHFHYFTGGVAGSGLLIVSRFPIEETRFRLYSVACPWYRLDQGDWWAGKGVALARIRLPEENGVLYFYATHLQARYTEGGYLAERETQLGEMKRFVSKTSLEGAPEVLAGDFNTMLGSKELSEAFPETEFRRLMTIRSRIDHIYGKEDSRYSYEVLESREIRKMIPLSNGKSTPLSDHPGYMSRIRIVPRFDSQSHK